MRLAIIGLDKSLNKTICFDLIEVADLTSGRQIAESIHASNPNYENIDYLDADAEGVKGVNDVKINGAWYHWFSVENLGWDSIRRERNPLLFSSDWTQLNDSPLTEAKKIEWAVYRQALRTITEDFADPTLVVFPTKPE